MITILCILFYVFSHRAIVHGFARAHVINGGSAARVDLGIDPCGVCGWLHGVRIDPCGVCGRLHGVGIDPCGVCGVHGVGADALGGKSMVSYVAFFMLLILCYLYYVNKPF